MSLLVEYHVKAGKEAEHRNAMETLIGALRAERPPGFTYSGFTADGGKRFLAVFEFADDAGKQRFLDSPAFAAYRDGSRDRFDAPPTTTEIALIATTAGPA